MANFTPSNFMADTYNLLSDMITRIQNDTDEFLETGDFDALPTIQITYKDTTVHIPLNLADCNEYITAQLEELKKLYEDIYL